MKTIFIVCFLSAGCGSNFGIYEVHTKYVRDDWPTSSLGKEFTTQWEITETEDNNINIQFVSEKILNGTHDAENHIVFFDAGEKKNNCNYPTFEYILELSLSDNNNLFEGSATNFSYFCNNEKLYDTLITILVVHGEKVDL